MEAANDAIIVTDPDGLIALEQGSGRCLRLLGRRSHRQQSPCTGCSAPAILAPIAQHSLASREPAPATPSRALHGASGASQGWREIAVEVSLASVRLRDGFHAIRRIVRDITERKRTENELKQFAAIVQSSDDAIIGKTLSGVVTSWNPGAETVFGYSAQEMIGRPMLDVFLPALKNEETIILDHIKRGESVTHFETLRRRKDGQVINVSVSISPVRDNDGSIVGVSTIARDISDKKQAEVELERHRFHLEELVTARTAELDRANKALSLAKDRARKTPIAQRAYSCRT